MNPEIIRIDVHMAVTAAFNFDWALPSEPVVLPVHFENVVGVKPCCDII